MSSFFSQLSSITPSSPSDPNSNPHAVPDPPSISDAERLLHAQFVYFFNGSTDEAHRERMEQLMSEIEPDIDNPPRKIEGVPQSYLDSLERVSRKELEARRARLAKAKGKGKGSGDEHKDLCPICNEEFLADEYPLVVRLPCHDSHVFDLECVGPWLRMKGTCPLDRKELMKKEVVKVQDEDEEDYDEMFA
jgi:hypothetical protein